MSGRELLRALALPTLLTLAGCASTPKRQLDLERIQERWLQLGSSQARADAPLAASEIDRLLSQWRAGKHPEVTRKHFAEVAEARLALFSAEVELNQLRKRMNELKDERREVLLQAAELQAQQARLEAERLRLQSLMREEESERIRAQAAIEVQGRELAEAEAQSAREEADLARKLAEAQAREAELARQENELLSAQAVDLRARLAGLRPESDKRGRKMTLGDVFFTTGQGELKPEARDAMKPIVEFIQRYPGKQVLIEGHTDDRGSEQANLKLSERRAQSVKAALIASGLSEARAVTVTGVGESKPVAENASSSGRARNRRVEVIVEGAQ
jgi:outer membrane protein OmpA-like peptidoglycan-associated protein